AVLNCELEYDTPVTPLNYCKQSGCRYCNLICPVQAYQTDSFDRQACFRHCQQNDAFFADLESCEVCGKCATGPCAYLE
ncbi:MAG TPA: epoxyqueuosine reductase, partial [Bacillota bacterium]|nr:epoxyqueuosine reductase [Bacillota bacterium]